MKKLFGHFLTCILLLFLLNTLFYSVYAAGEDVTESNWVKKAFSATYSFLTESVDVSSSSASEPEKMVGKAITIFRDVVKAVNAILIVALFGISAVSISIVGIRFMVSREEPKAIEKAKEDLRTTFIGMAYGFGAFLIWNIAMSIVKTIIEAFV